MGNKQTLTKKELLDICDKVIKLNEELMAENARLLEKEDHRISLVNQLDIVSTNKANLNIKHLKLIQELEAIKSKWWYKLMTWGW